MERERAPAVGHEPRVAHDGAVAAIEALGQPQQVGQRADGLPVGRVEARVGRVARARRGLAVKQRGRRHDGDLALVEAEQVGVGDEVGRVHVVVGVRDEGAHVVQQGGVLEQLAFLVAERVEAGVTRAVEELERQARYVAGVGLIGAAGPYQPQNAALADGELVHEGRVRAARQVVHEQPVAQPALGQGGHGGQLEVGHQRLEHDRAGDDDVGAVGVQARHPAPLVERQAAQQLDHLAHVGEARRLVALRLAVVQDPGGHRGHVAGRARRAVGDVDVEAADGRHRVHRRQAHGALQPLVVIASHPAGDVGQAGIAGQAHRAERQAVQEQVPAGVADDHLGAAPADVETEGEALAELDAALHAQVDEARLFAAGHDVHVESGLVAQARHKGALIVRLAGRRRGHRDDLVGAVAARQTGERGADEHGALDRRGTQQVVGELLLAQAHDLALQVDHLVRAPGGDPHHHEPHRVRADVDEADDVAVVAAAAAVCRRCRLRGPSWSTPYPPHRAPPTPQAQRHS